MCCIAVWENNNNEDFYAVILSPVLAGAQRATKRDYKRVYISMKKNEKRSKYKEQLSKSKKEKMGRKNREKNPAILNKEHAVQITNNGRALNKTKSMEASHDVHTYPTAV